MGLKDVKNDILREAKDKASQIEQEAKEKEKQILEEAEKQAEEIKKEAEKELEEQKETERKKTISEANMQARQKKMEAKQEKLEETFQSFEEELRNLSQQEKEKFVENAIEETKFEIVEIEASEDFADVIDGRTYNLVENSELNGFVLVSENGERRRNFSIDKIVDSYREEHRQKVAEKLFEDES